MLEMLLKLLLNGGVVLAVARVVPGIRLPNYGTALWVAGVFGILNLFLKGILVSLSFPLIVVSFGLFLLVLNGFLLWLTDKLLSRFEITTFAALVQATLGVSFGFFAVDFLLGR